MKKYQYIPLILITSLITLLIHFYILGSFMLPILINTEAIKTQLSTYASQNLSSKIQISKIDFKVIPLPQITLKKVQISKPGQIKADIATIYLYPDFRSIMKGNTKAFKIHILEPNINIEHPKKGTLSLNKEQKLEKVVNVLVKKQLNMDISIEKGFLQVNISDQPPITVQDIYLDMYLSKKLVLKNECSSNLWEQMSLNIQASNLQDLKFSGQIKIKKIAAHKISNYFSPTGPIWVSAQKGSYLNLLLDFNIKGFDSFQTKFQGDIPVLYVYNKANKEKSIHQIQASTFIGRYLFQDKEKKLFIDDLILKKPKLNLQGHLISSLSKPSWEIKLKGEQIDITPLRSILLDLSLLEKELGEVFTILRGGYMPNMSMQTNGSSRSELISHLDINGTIEDGKVFVPKGDLSINQVHGDFTLEDKIIKSHNLQANTNQLRVSSKKLYLGLNDEIYPFYLQGNFQGKVDHIPAFLKRIISNKQALQRINAFQNLEGKATGDILLNRTKGKFQSRINAHSLDLKLKYQNLPYFFNIQGNKLKWTNSKLYGENLHVQFGESKFQLLSGTLDWQKDPKLDLIAKNCKFNLTQLFPLLQTQKKLKPLLQNISNIKGMLYCSSLKLSGPATNSKRWEYEAKGKYQDLKIYSPNLPSLLICSSGNFQITPLHLSIQDCHTQIMDASFQFSGTVPNYLQNVSKPKIQIQGNFGPDSLNWITKEFAIPNAYLPRAPLVINQGNLEYNAQNYLCFKGEIKIANSVKLEINIEHTPQKISVHKLNIIDEYSQTQIQLKFTKKTQAIDFAFDGKLSSKSLDQILLHQNKYIKDSLQGDFQSKIQLAPFAFTSAQGWMEIKELSCPLTLGTITINQLEMEASSNKLDIKSGDLSYLETNLKIHGEISDLGSINTLNLNLQTEELKWESIQNILNLIEDHGQEKGIKLKEVALNGTINLKSELFTYKDLKWKPLEAKLLIDKKNRIEILISKARLCSLPTLGEIVIEPNNISIDLRTEVKDQQLEHTIPCFKGPKKMISGGFDLNVHLHAQAQNKKDLVDSLNGDFQLVAYEGRIYRLNILAKIFAILNTTELFWGNIPDLEKQGMGYKQIDLKGNITGGILQIKKGVVDGDSMEIGFQGKIDYLKDKINMTALIAPLKTVDRLLKKIPLLGRIFGGNLVSVPVGITGKLSDPHIIPMSPKAVSSELLNIMKRTIQLPIDILQPLIQEKKE